MSLYIESQDKEFLGIFKKFQQCHAEILGYDETWEDDTKVVLGEYSSPERAKEVMSEIKEFIRPILFVKDFDFNDETIIDDILKGGCFKYKTFEKGSDIQLFSHDKIFEMPQE